MHRLEPHDLVAAYVEGSFPMDAGRHADGPLRLFHADPRAVLPLPMRVPRSVRRGLAHHPYAFRVSAAFDDAVRRCARWDELPDDEIWISERLAARTPWFIGAVVALSFVLLLVLFRSVLVPLKAALMNLLSIGASYGLLVAVFQWGWGATLIGLDEPMPISPFVPMIMFAILFGLSMDYEVFLLSRVREEFVRHGDSHRSVVDGLAGTARVITSAALIMISVFGAFVLAPNPMLKMFGLGLASAVLIDATIVRMVLVPATMALLGGANWWLPGWLDRLLPHVDIEGGPELDPADEVRGPAVAPEPQPA